MTAFGVIFAFRIEFQVIHHYERWPCSGQTEIELFYPLSRSGPIEVKDA